MNNRTFFKTISFIHSGVFVGVFCSSFVTEITKDQKILLRDFYKTTSFYVLLFLSIIELVKNIVIDTITKNNNEIERLTKIIARNEETVSISSKSNTESSLELNTEENQFNQNRELSIEEIKIYTKKKIIDAISDRYVELVSRGDPGEELARLDDILRRIFED
jgi:sugar-specific transcriptional regulator TrmB